MSEHTIVTQPYPVRFSVAFPDHQLNKLSTALRLFWAIPILIVAGAVAGGHGLWSAEDSRSSAIGAAGLLIFAPAVMIIFRQKYPRWWFEWNRELQSFSNRVVAYLALMTDQYPATDEEQSVHLDYTYPEVGRDINRWMPIVKWFLAIPHYVVLFFLAIAMVGAVIIAWFAILFTGQYPRRLFDFVEGVMRWNNRVIGYVGTLVTDEYPPFRLSA
jgi:hypothetical protein